ncbi:MAG TPA: ABC transporter permease [Candidatus Limnocylindria bacterium]|nr:ABC transporter permease [Candidatus Limnocylindria bacterium]
MSGQGKARDERTLRRSFWRLMLLVARRDYLRTIRRRGFVFGTLLLPAGIAGFVLLSTFLSPTFEPAPTVPPVVPIVNQSALPLNVPDHLRVNELDEQEAQRSLQGGELREFYLVGPDYPADPTVTRVLSPSRSPSIEDLQRRTQQELVLAAVMRSTLVTGQDLPDATVERLLRPVELEEESLDGVSPIPGFEAGFLLPYAFTFLFVMSIFITSGYLLQSVTEEKENRVVEILLSSVPPLPLMAGKILGLGAAGLTQVAVWVLTGLVAVPIIGSRFPQLTGFEVDPLSLGLALIVFALGYLAYGAIFAAIGALAPGTREAQQYSGFFGFFAVVPLIFAGAFLADPQSPLVVALCLIPLTAPAALLQVLALTGEPPWPLFLASLLSLSLFAIVAAIAAARIFRATLLLYGVRPSLRRIVGAVTARD